jgi:prepilin-type N-terminal cleavage/methylation domain-containing protein
MGMNRFTDRMRSQRGVTLIEMLLVVAVMGVIGAMGTAQIAVVRRSLQGDGAMRLLMGQLNQAREMAVTQRRTMEIKFVGGAGGNWIQVLRHEVPGTATTTLSSVAFEGNVTYRLIPTVTTDTPDAFGNASALAFGAATTYTFSTDGTLIDGSGNPLNGTIFLAVSNVAGSQRAVTIMGGTGRVRGYKWACNSNNVCAWNRV